mmetsp:Transcript_107081/g.245104  ORF Transcript_107081/g.245104 Transcript_107081/m.245104 type:complete len:211 (-) Transcript_107081:842-1474(-)
MAVSAAASFTASSAAAPRAAAASMGFAGSSVTASTVSVTTGEGSGNRSMYMVSTASLTVAIRVPLFHRIWSTGPRRDAARSWYWAFCSCRSLFSSHSFANSDSTEGLSSSGRSPSSSAFRSRCSCHFASSPSSSTRSCSTRVVTIPYLACSLAVSAGSVTRLSTVDCISWKRRAATIARVSSTMDFTAGSVTNSRPLTLRAAILSKADFF